MFVIKTRIGPSRIHGTGCFTVESIQKGQVIWRPDHLLDLVFTEDQVVAFPEAARTFLYMYTYTELRHGKKAYILSADHSRHMNHSETPNVISLDSIQDIAGRDIAAGEELTCNYHTFDLDAEQKLRH
jgi:hypothetical protein